MQLAQEPVITEEEATDLLDERRVEGLSPRQLFWRLFRRDRLALDEREAHAQPGHRGSLLEETAAHERGLHPGVVARLVAGGKEGDGAATVRARRPLGKRGSPWRRA